MMTSFFSVFLSLVVCVTLLPAVTIHAKPIQANTCAYMGLDFSSLMNGPDLTGSDGGQTYTYAIHVCGALASYSACTKNIPTASECQIQGGAEPSFWVTGEWNPTQPAV